MHSEFPRTASEAIFKSSAHWISTYKDGNNKCTEKQIEQPKRPKWSEIAPAHVSDRMFKETEYHKSFGTFGFNPRNKLPSTTTKLINEETPHMYYS